jgi:hypothetical protein
MVPSNLLPTELSCFMSSVFPSQKTNSLSIFLLFLTFQLFFMWGSQEKQTRKSYQCDQMDSSKMSFWHLTSTNDPELQQHLHGQYRTPWVKSDNWRFRKPISYSWKTEIEQSHKNLFMHLDKSLCSLCMPRKLKFSFFSSLRYNIWKNNFGSCFYVFYLFIYVVLYFYV